jgi:hypothetical protein
MGGIRQAWVAASRAQKATIAIALLLAVGGVVALASPSTQPASSQSSATLGHGSQAPTEPGDLAAATLTQTVGGSPATSKGPESTARPTAKTVIAFPGSWTVTASS